MAGRAGVAPAFPFGHGLGYTTWSYDGIDDPVTDDGGTVVRVRLRNTGDRRGRKVVQVYASRTGSAVVRPVRWLAGFLVVEADPGERETASGSWAVEPATFRLEAGSSSADRRLAAAVRVRASGEIG